MPHAAQGSHHSVTKLACRSGSWPRVHSLCQVVGCLAASALLALVLRLLLPPRLGLALDLVVAVPVVALVVAVVALVGGVAVGLQPHSVAAAGRATRRLPAVPVAADSPVQLLPYCLGERLGGGSL
jgi:hypothetical protein